MGEYKAGRVEPKMDHLGCFCGKHFVYHKVTKFSDTYFLYCNVCKHSNLKLQTKRIFHGVIPPNDANGMSLVVRKPVLGISNQVRHKSGSAATEDG